MLLFSVIALAAALLVAGLLFRAMRSTPSPSIDPAEAGWAVMVARRREIEEDPNLDEELRKTLIDEWQQQAHALDAQPGEQGAAASRPARPWLLPLLVVAVGVAVYAAIGTLNEPAMRLHFTGFGGPSVMAREAPPRAGENHPGGKGSIEERIAALEAKLKESPDNLEGWVILARSRALQRNYPAAATALEQALRLAPGHPDLLADLADALAMANGEKLAGRPMELVAEALKSDPKHQKSLALAATAAMQADKKAEAAILWRKLQSQFTPADPDFAQINNILAQMGEKPTPGAAQPAPPGTDPALAGKTIRGEVALSAAAVQQARAKPLPPSATLFILAKAVSGPPMPLAVVRLPVTDLVAGKTIPFQLDDSQAMSPQLTVSRFPQVSVEARISMSGNASRQPGDWSAARSPVTVGAGPVLLQIDAAKP